MIGETVGNFQVVKLIGQGGMGVVYLAEHPALGRRAVKVLNAGMARNAEIVGRFLNEARAANAVRHPGVVQAFDFGTLPSGADYIIMEFLEGESLSVRLKREKRLDVATAVEIAWQTADVLAATHDRGIVHRDLKPDNLFLVGAPDGAGPERVKVLDFGLAKLNLTDAGANGVRTETGTIVGTPRYMSPEQSRGTREVDRRADIYSLGVILYHMLCGWPPFTAAGQGEVIHMHIAVEPPPPRSYNKLIPPGLEAVILKALAKDPRARQQSMGELQRELRSFPRDVPPLTEPPAPPVDDSRLSSTLPATPVVSQTTSASGTVESRMLKPPRSRWPLLATLGVLAAGGIGAGVMLRRGETPLPAAAPAAEPAPTPTAAPATIAVAITTEPSGVMVVRARDGAALGVTPFRESWPAGGGTESLRLERAGYRTERLVVPLDRGVDLEFALQKLETSGASSAPAPISGKKHVRAVRDEAPPSVPNQPETQSPVEPSSIEAAPRAEPEPVPL